jgi:hypothetical protein
VGPGTQGDGRDDRQVGLHGATGVSLCGVAVTSFWVVPDTHVQVTSPPSVTGTFDMTVATAGGSPACGTDSASAPDWTK